MATRIIEIVQSPTGTFITIDGVLLQRVSDAQMKWCDADRCFKFMYYQHAEASDSRYRHSTTHVIDPHHISNFELTFKRAP